MKPLSVHLNELADRARKAEDFVAVARAKNRAALDAQRELLKFSVGEGKARAEAGSAAASGTVQSWWDDIRFAFDEKFAALQARLDERRTEHDVKQAERRAADAEQDAVGAVQFAIFMLDQAEYAVADAVIARAEAAELASARVG
jgi:hypothetical protein